MYLANITFTKSTADVFEPNGTLTLTLQNHGPESGIVCKYTLISTFLSPNLDLLVLHCVGDGENWSCAPIFVKSKAY